MSETDAIIVGRELPRIAAVTALPPSRLTIEWLSGSRGGRVEAIDLSPMLHTMKLYRPLRDDPDLFAAVKVTAFGSAVSWGEDEAIDASAVALEELAEQSMTTDEFRAFLSRNKLTFDSAAAQLGISRRLVAYYASEREVPRCVALACCFLDGAKTPVSSSRSRP